MKTLQSLSSKECIYAYELMLKNSKTKWREAKKQNLLSNYSTATALLIISTEELIKALIFAIDSRGNNLRAVPGINKFFKNHEIRYFIAYPMFIFHLIGKEFTSMFEKIKAGEIDLHILKEEMVNDSNAFFVRNRIWFYRKIVVLNKELEWFAGLDKLRQQSFYCDYEVNKFITPQEIDEEKYLEVYSRLEKVNYITNGFIKAFTSEKGYKQLQEIAVKTKFDKKKVYTIISELLAVSKKERKSNPFDSLKKIMKSLNKHRFEE